MASDPWALWRAHGVSLPRHDADFWYRADDDTVDALAYAMDKIKKPGADDMLAAICSDDPDDELRRVCGLDDDD